MSSGGSWRLSWEGFGGYVGRCWLQEDGFRWFLGPCGDILVAGQCLKPLLSAPWLGAGWLAEELGGPGGAQDGRYHPELDARNAGGARGGRAETYRFHFLGLKGFKTLSLKA